MASMKQCRVCGKNYDPCHTPGLQIGVFRWREVSCSPECGAIYLRQIEESRNPSKKVDRPKEKSVSIDVVIGPNVESDTIDSNRD